MSAALACMLALQPFGSAVAYASVPSVARVARVAVAPGTGAMPSSDASAAPTGMVIVGMQPGFVAGALAKRGHGLGGADIARSGHVALVRVPAGKTPRAFAAELAADSAVAYAAPDYVRSALAYTGAPNDADYNDSTSWGSAAYYYPYGKSWWERDVTMSSLWSALGGPSYAPRATGSDIKVAVIDTGMYLTHPDAGSTIVVGKDEFETYNGSTYTTDNDVTPYNAPVSTTYAPNDAETRSHGTCCAGQISAGTNNGVGVAGVSYDATVLVYKVRGNWTTGSVTDPSNYPPGCAVMLDSAIINAIRDATDAGARVISLSLGGSQYSSATQAAIDYAYGKGVLVVAATGNNGANNYVLYPGANNHVVGVGSYNKTSDSARVRSSFTNYGVGADPVDAGANNGQLDVLAPGVMIWGLTQPDYDADGSGTVSKPGYEFWQGTSMATPAFAGMAALVWRFMPALTPDELSAFMLQNSLADGTGWPNTAYGWGYIRPVAALDDMKSDYPVLSTPVVTAPSTSATTAVSVSWTAVSGRSVTYGITDNGSVLVTGTASTSRTVTLGVGVHALRVVPLSAYNWSGVAGAATVTVDLSAAPPVAPAISVASPFVTTPANSATWAAVPNATSYEWRLNGGSSASLGGATSVAISSGVVEGTNTVEVRAVNGGGASAWSAATFAYVSVPAAPAITSPASVSSADYGLTWNAASGATGYQYRLNGGSVMSVGSVTSTPVTLLLGANTVFVRSLRAVGLNTTYSTWTTATVTYTPPAPGAPSVSLSTDYTAIPSVTASWPAVVDATSYDYQFNAGPVTQNGASRSLLISEGIVEGVNTLNVRAVGEGGAGAWATATFTFIVIPGAPAITSATSTADPAYLLTWDAAPNATGYEYRVNGATVRDAGPSTSAAVTLGIGDNNVQVRAVRAAGPVTTRSDWVSQTVAVAEEPGEVFAFAGSSATTVTYGATATIATQLVEEADGPEAGAMVFVESSTDQIAWTPLGTEMTGVDGKLSRAVKPLCVTWYRFTYGSASVVVRASVRASVGTPKAPTSHSHHSSFTVYGYLKPQHAAGVSTYVQLKAYRKNTHTGAYELKYTKWAKTYAYSATTTKYSASVRLTTTGTWRIYARYAGTGAFDAVTSSYDSVRVY